MKRPRKGQARRAFTLEKLEQVIDRLDDATSKGARLVMDLATLAHDEARYDANLRVRKRIEAEWAEMNAETERLREAGR
jgi:hypothetical protein